jgi:hypothetical protein
MKTLFPLRTVAGLLTAAVLAPLTVFACGPLPDLTRPEQKEKRAVVQLAILLDTSSSMQGLIEQAKGQLWRIVNEFITARQNGVQPDLEVALYEYGKSSLASAQGWVRRIVPLTNDLDRISEELFKLTTNGGDEYCGWVIRDAVEQLAWNPSPDAFKAIFIAGNEPFTQGPVPYAKACQAAITKGIIVNTIHCGNHQDGVQTKWQEGAQLAEGKYMVIDQNRAVVHVPAPQDPEIARLGMELNKTYLAFGAQGQANLARQNAQDANSLSLAAQGSSVQRAIAKSSAYYANGTWDLVDASKNKSLRLSELKTEELPAEMQKMTETERKSYVETKSQEREKLQKEIHRLNQQRSAFLAEQSKKQTATNTLDNVIVSAVREQAGKRNYRFD